MNSAVEKVTSVLGSRSRTGTLREVKIADFGLSKIINEDRKCKFRRTDLRLQAPKTAWVLMGSDYLAVLSFPVLLLILLNNRALPGLVLREDLRGHTPILGA